MSTFDRADDLLYGCILALLMRTRARSWILASAPTIFTACCAYCVLLGIQAGKFTTDSPWIATFGLVSLDLAAAALIAMSLVPRSKTSRFLGTPLLRWFGRYSYGIYVYHYSLYGLITHWLRPFINAHFGSKLLAVLVNALVVGGITCAIAVASYHLYEARFLKIKRFFSYASGPALIPRDDA